MPSSTKNGQLTAVVTANESYWRQSVRRRAAAGACSRVRDRRRRQTNSPAWSRRRATTPAEPVPRRPVPPTCRTGRTMSPGAAGEASRRCRRTLRRSGSTSPIWRPAGRAPQPLNVRSIERRLSGLAWGFRQRGHTLDRSGPAHQGSARWDPQQAPPAPEAEGARCWPPTSSP